MVTFRMLSVQMTDLDTSMCGQLVTLFIKNSLR